MEKVIKDGKVAVLYSPGYGSGWYTDNPGYPELVFDSILVNAVIEGDIEKGMARAKELCPYAEFRVLKTLKVGWVPVGEAFDITAYDGSEKLKIISEQNYFIA